MGPVELLHGPPAEHLRCALCSWRSETDWEPTDVRPLRADLEWAAHARLLHPIMADWLAPAFSGVRQN